MASGDSKKFLRLDDLEHKSIDEADYKQKLKEQQLKLLKLQRQLSESKHSVLIVFEGPDAAGKGGAIKRLVERLDPAAVARLFGHQAHGGGIPAPLHVALLEQTAALRADGDLRPLLVRARARGAGGRIRHG